MTGKFARFPYLARLCGCIETPKMLVSFAFTPSLKRVPSKNTPTHPPPPSPHPPTHPRTCAPTHTETHTHTHSDAHTHTHTVTHTHTQTQTQAEAQAETPTHPPAHPHARPPTPRVCVCGVTEYPVTNFRLLLLPQGDAGDLCGRHPTKTPHLSCDIELITSTYLCISCDAKSFWPPWLRRCLCFLLFRVTCSLLEGSRVHREQNPHPLETHQLYSRLISCTRKISTLHLEFKCVHPIRGESSGVPIV